MFQVASHNVEGIFTAAKTFTWNCYSDQIILKLQSVRGFQIIQLGAIVAYWNYTVETRKTPWLLQIHRHGKNSSQKNSSLNALVKQAQALAVFKPENLFFEAGWVVLA